MALFKYTFLIFVIFLIPFARGSRVNPKTGRKIIIERAPANFTFDSLRVHPNGEIRVAQLNPAKRKWNTEPLGMAKPDVVEFRIVGGRSARIKEVPYTAILGEYNFGPTCGATIYNKEWIISAAHCFAGSFGGFISKSGVYITVGVTDFNRKDRTEQTSEISEYIVHPDYMSKPGFSDISLAKLAKPLVYTDVVQPLPIGPASEEYPAPGEAVISGWGYTKARPFGTPFEDAFFPSSLRRTTIDILTREECVDVYSQSSNGPKSLSSLPTVMCAGILEGGKDACSGDSGGPLRCTNSEGKKYLCGIIATGVGCGVPKRPGFYTIVSKYAEWIKKNAGEADQPTVDY